MKKNNIGYLLREGFRGVFLHGFMSFAAICVTVACLIIMGSFCLILYNTSAMVKELEQKNEMLVYIDESYSEAKAKSVGSQINLITNVRSAVFVSREQALEDFIDEQNDASLFAGIDPDTLRDRYVVTVEDNSLLKQTYEKLKDIEGVADVSAHFEIAEGFQTVQNVLNIASLVIVSVLFVVSLFIISNTVKLAMYSRSEEIAIMKMVGATNAFILHITDSAQVAELLASELDGQQRKYPRSTPSEEESMAIQRLRSTAQMKALMLGAGPMAAAAGNADDAPSDDPFVVQSRSGTDWTVLYYPSIGMADSLSTPLNRTVNIVAVDHVEDALPTLRPYAQWLQTCGVALAPDRLFDVAQRVGETGIDRICPIGEMNRAKSGWHHDGGFNLLDLVHAVDIERNTDTYCDGFDMDVE